MSDLFDNPMVRNAQRALTPEQIEEYKQIGEYMYNNTEYVNTEISAAKIKQASPSELLSYAEEALKAGGDPKDLTPAEINILTSVYGREWYKKFDLEEDDIPKFAPPMNSLNTPSSVLDYVEQGIKDMKLSRQQRRMMERKIAKERSRLEK